MVMDLHAPSSRATWLSLAAICCDGGSDSLNWYHGTDPAAPNNVIVLQFEGERPINPTAGVPLYWGSSLRGRILEVGTIAPDGFYCKAEFQKLRAARAIVDGLINNILPTDFLPRVGSVHRTTFVARHGS